MWLAVAITNCVCGNCSKFMNILTSHLSIDVNFPGTVLKGN